MSVQLITYDLVKPGRDYAKLFEAIKALGAWCHCVESVWLVTTRLGSGQVRESLARHIDGNDKLVVMSLAGDWDTQGVSKERLDWLRTQLAA